MTALSTLPGDPVSTSEDVRDLARRARALELTMPRDGAALATRAIVLARDSGDREALAQALLAAAWCRFRLTEGSAILPVLHEARDLFIELGDRFGQAECLYVSGCIHSEMADIAAALDLLGQSLDLYRTVGDQRGEITAMNSTANAYSVMQRYPEALALYNETLALALEAGEIDRALLIRTNRALTLTRQGEAEAARGEHDAAQRSYLAALASASEALPHIRQLGNRVRESQCLGVLGHCHRSLGDYDRALEVYAETIAVAEFVGDQRTVTLTEAHIGEIYFEQGRHDLAIPRLVVALQRHQTLALREQAARVWRYLSLARAASGDYRQALTDYQAFHELEVQVRSVEAEQRAQASLAEMRLEQLRREAALHREREAELTALNDRLQAQARQLQEQALLLSRHAHEDGLTGLANRRSLDQHLATSAALSGDGGAMPAVAIADIDHFKQINDRFSHLIGDEVLREVGQIIQAQCRAHDFAARYGGEEFVIALADCSRSQAYFACERLRRAVESHDWERVASSLRVTLSLGYAADPDLRDGTALLAAADQQLYRAKQSGRNRVCPAP